VSLLDSEIARAKAELGYNLISIGAPYIGTTALFEQAVQPYLEAGATTTSSTSVTHEAPPVPKAITLADATGFSAGDRVVVDVDARQEVVTVQALSGASLTALFTKTHSGTYPVTVEGGESIVREKLSAIVAFHESMKESSDGLGSLKKADDAEWYQAGGGASVFATQREDLMALRDELASVLGVANLWRVKQSAGARLSVY
jgi:hypothetical protein